MISEMNIYLNFRKFLHKAGISHSGRGKGPRIYNFRHTFAVHSLKSIVLAGKDLAVYHQGLKTYMGHSFFKYTAYYLQLTKDMFPDIREKVEAHYSELFIANCESSLKGEGSKESEGVKGKTGAKKQPPESRRKGLLK